VAVNDQQFADVLNGSCAQFAADLFVVSDPVIATVAINTNLDQLVGLEAVVDFLENRLEAVFGNRDDQVMGLGAQFATLGRI
jgi:hypothetical protein